MLHLQEKVEKLHRLLKESGRVAVAFSGGVDSSFLLKSALDVLGAGNVVILHAHSCLQRRIDRVRADTWLERHGYSPDIKPLTVELQPLSWKEFAANSEQRCYLCKLRMYTIFLDEIDRLGVHVLLDGTNIDDLKDHRPGLRAIHELGVLTPLVACGLGKAEVRLLSRELRLDTFDQASSSCLATRIPHGMEITASRLQLIESWESGLEELGFSDSRVRMDGTLKRIVYLQLLQADLDLMGKPEVRRAVQRFFHKMGVDRVYLNLQGR